MDAKIIELEISICQGARHSWLKKAKELIRKNNADYEIFAELAEREQSTIDKLESLMPLTILT